MWTKACLEAWTRSATALVIATAGEESEWSDRNVLRRAISTFCSFQGTTWLFRRMTRNEVWAADSRSTDSLRARFRSRLFATKYALLSTSVFSISS